MAKVGFRAGVKRAKWGGVLPGTGLVCAALFRPEEALAGDGGETYRTARGGARGREPPVLEASRHRKVGGGIVYRGGQMYIKGPAEKPKRKFRLTG